MKNLIFSICIFFCTNFSVNAQSDFESESDVLYYLDTKGSFSNENSGITLSFSDMATNLSTGRAKYYQPEVIVISNNIAYVTYVSSSYSGLSASFKVDSKQNILIDRKDRTIYSAYSYESSDNSNSNNENTERQTVTLHSKTNSKPAASKSQGTKKYVLPPVETTPFIEDSPRPQTVNSNIKVKTSTENSSDKINNVSATVDVMPSFPGGEAELNKYLAENIIYPQQAFENGIQGTVYVSFIVDLKGNLTDVKLLRGIGSGCDQEALRVVQMMPQWHPGQQKGKIVPVLYKMPVYFKLQ
jgi:protein TonB